MMLSDDVLIEIAKIICGDNEDFYTYKSGPKLVSFFNEFLSANDIYGQGFPSRWKYTYDKLVCIIDKGVFDSLLELILGKQYLIKEWGCTEVEAIEKSELIFSFFNKILAKDQYVITHHAGKFHLVKKDEDMVLIGSGGFANAYYQKSTGHVVKKLKEDFVLDEGIRSRFKREYDITKSLQDMQGIIKVYYFDEGKCEYSMERAEQTLENYVCENILSDDIKLNCIRQILCIMTEVHERDIIHRDLSPNNIFIISGKLKIADFGLGKDLKVFASHQTIHTNAVGQYYYCAPEQFMMLKDADKRSDVYSIGRIMNFVMTGDPTNSHHIYGNVCSKATNSDAAYRYGDAIQLSVFFEKSVKYHQQESRGLVVQEKIDNKDFDADVEEYIYELSAEDISKMIKKGGTAFADSIIWFMGLSEENAEHIVQGVESTFKKVCGRTYEAYDPFANLAEKIIKGKFDYPVKERAASVIRYIAWDVNRFDTRRKIERIIDNGVDPLIEELIRG